MAEEIPMEKRLTSVEHGLELLNLHHQHAQQATQSSLQGMQSQLADINRTLRESLKSQENSNNEEIDALREEFAETRRELGVVGKKMMYYSGGIAACGVIGVALISIVVYVFNATNTDHANRISQMRVDYDRRLQLTEQRFEKYDAKSDKQLQTLHNIELYLARRGEPGRGDYTGDDKK